MDHFERIYAHEAEAYQRMIAAEDVDGNILAALEAITPLKGKRILDLGSGTGRMPLLLHTFSDQIIGIDLNLPMLREQQRQRARLNGSWHLLQGDMRCLPVESGWSEVTLAGWAIGHMTSWFSSDWRVQIGKVIIEMQRVTAPNGVIFILETLTTGAEKAAPPNQDLADYYAWLENQHGFTRSTIQTDYLFKSVEEAVQHTEFFFGTELAQTIRERSWARLPEWTGIWSKTG
jgi:ubiquinone/menaquinone biosynthesis C-methylase UbiE